jgi:hypothetical protein
LLVNRYTEITFASDAETNSTRFGNPGYWLNLFANSNFSGQPSPSGAWNRQSFDATCDTADASSSRSCVALVVNAFEKILKMSPEQTSNCGWGNQVHQVRVLSSITSVSSLASSCGL